jgi:hypothetical protein
MKGAALSATVYMRQSPGEVPAGRRDDLTGKRMVPTAGPRVPFQVAGLMLTSGLVAARRAHAEFAPDIVWVFAAGLVVLAAAMAAFYQRMERLSVTVH